MKKVLSLVIVFCLLISSYASASTLIINKNEQIFKNSACTKKYTKIKKQFIIKKAKIKKGYVSFKFEKKNCYVKLNKIKFKGSTIGKTTLKTSVLNKKYQVVGKLAKGKKVNITGLNKKKSKVYFVIQNKYLIDSKNIEVANITVKINKKYNLSDSDLNTSTPVPATPTSTPTPIPITTNEPAPSFIGRFLDKGDYYSCDWSGSKITARFNGDNCYATLSSNNSNNYIDVIVDDKVVNTINVPKTKTRTLLVNNLKKGEHYIEIVKRTEGNQGLLNFYGFEFDGDSVLINNFVDKERLIEFVGDSITCGYGIEGDDPNQNFTPENENANKTYAALTAKNLNANYHSIAISGSSVSRYSYSGIITERYENTLFNDRNPSTKYAFTGNLPQVVVINIGTNDFGVYSSKNNNVFPEDEFITEYAKLYELVRSKNPNAKIVLTQGAMLDGANKTAIIDYLKNYVAKLNSSTDDNVYFYQMETQNIGLNGAGEDYHPSEKTNQINAKGLTAYLKKLCNW